MALTHEFTLIVGNEFVYKGLWSGMSDFDIYLLVKAK